MIDQLLAWAVAHSAVLAAFVVATLDLVFALNPKTESQGVLHFLYLQAKKLLPGSSSGT